MSRIAPTPRAAGAIALVGLLALVAPVWVPAGALLALLAAAAVDAWEVRTPPPIERDCQTVLSRGVASPFRVLARPADRRTVLLRQPASGAIAVQAALQRGELHGMLVAHRRGRHVLAGVASASIGPLGLVRAHHPCGPPLRVSVYPDLAAAMALIARLRARTLAGHAGRSVRGALGLGTDFESVRDYSPDDDIRQLNWRASARVGRPMSNQYRLEQDRDLVCLIDTGRLMGAPVDGRTMLDAALDAACLLALATDELGDRCGAVAFDETVHRYLAPQHRSGRAVLESLLDLEARPVDSDFERAFLRIGVSRRALVFVFTDLVDEAAAASLRAGMPMLARRHAVSVVSVLDSALEAIADGEPGSPLLAATQLVALDVLAVRAQAAAALRRAGASVLEAPPERLAARCLDVYLRAKARARL